jgi:hypothetical protein
MGTATQVELDEAALMAAGRYAFRVCTRDRPRGDEEHVAREILSELWDRHGTELGGMSQDKLKQAAVAVCKMLGKRQGREERRFEAYTEAENAADGDADKAKQIATARQLAIDAQDEHNNRAATRDRLDVETSRLGITDKEATKRRKRIKRGCVAEKLEREEMDAVAEMIVPILETPAPKVRRGRKSDFDRVEPNPPLWDAASTEPGLLQLGQEDAAKTDRHGRVVPFVPEDGAWWKLLIGGETKGKMGGVTHEPATWPKLHTCVLAFALRPEDIRELAGPENLLGKGRGGCRIHPRGLQKVAEDFLKTLEHLEPAFDADGSKDSWRGNAKKLLKRLVRILEKV